MHLIKRLLYKFNHLSRRSKIATILIVLGTIGLIAFLNQNNKDAYQPYTVTTGDISETIVVSGNANASGNAAIYSPSTGIAEELFVTNGSFVEKGQELAKIQSTALEKDRANAYAAYQAATSALKTAVQSKVSNQSALETARKAVLDASAAQQQMNDRRSTGASNPATDKEYKQDEIDSINSSLTSAKTSFGYYEKKYLDSDSAIAAAQGNVDASRLAYEATMNSILKSPVTGQVINLSVSVGDSVIAKTTQNDPLPVLRITSEGELSVKIKLSELDIPKVTTKQQAIVRFDALPEKEFKGIVTRIDTAGTNENAAVTYMTYVRLLDYDERIKPEMTATVTILTNPKRNVLLIPNTALIKDADKLLVKTSPNGSSEKSIQIGMKNEKYSEVLTGLKKDEVIYVPTSK